MSGAALAASYRSPISAQNFSLDLPPPPQSGSVDEKTSYLAALRTNASKLQGEINTFLTQKMEEDKAAEAGKGTAKKKVDEQREEDMYGEEDPENDG
ncbi:hypothetical protein CB0940_00939 [Cercospora beticola]|uniref:EKC/KEOPS complex subunit GON7 n=1 Tax=Cercospora beticola TaxID=122368 RepID=A0A2G5I7K2_CERBT|nr:hypothetical protein CB0940_00939 [Cercospora beticola]PIB00760.1 hypothetical protein CB0940_00939 [Cercospora beticola]WPA96366.1 hypothetical protein RHO25_000973 [Cercospora beticola]CAK1355326.1 unnamed protein product [Cercospora beticola]